VNDPIINPPAAVRTAEALAGLFASANAEHDAGRQAEQVALEHYRKAGAALLKAKAAAGHGNWLKVLKEQCRIPTQRASEYMRLAEGWDKLPTGGNSTLKGALGQLAEVENNARDAEHSRARAFAESALQATLQANGLSEGAAIDYTLRVDAGMTRVDGFVFTKTGLLVVGEPTFEQYLSVGRVLGEAARHYAEIVYQETGKRL
jgi:hypothetical protein